MTNSEVFIAKCLHYNPSPLTVKDLLDDVGLKPEEDCTDKRKVVSAVLSYLSECVPCLLKVRLIVPTRMILSA